jgi:hypothetical protein
MKGGEPTARETHTYVERDSPTYVERIPPQWGFSPYCWPSY